MILHKIIGAWQIRYAEKLSDAQSIAKQMTAEDGENAHVYRMTCTIDPNVVSVATMKDGYSVVS